MEIDIEFNSGAQLPLDAIPSLAVEAERSGFGCAWGGEANNKDPTVMLGSVAAVTNRLAVGTAVYHMLGRTPATLALQALGLQEVSRGRFLLGLGISNPTIAGWHGVPMDRPLARIKEYLQIVRAMLTGEKVSYEGEFYRSHGFKAAFKPAGQRIPIYLAAFGPQMSRLAGRLSDGVVINMANPTELRRIVEQAREGAQKAGRDPDALEIICKVRCCVSEDVVTGRKALEKILTYYVLADYYRDLFTRMGFGEEVASMRAKWRTSGFHAARSMITDRLFNGVPVLAARSAAEVLERLQAYRRAGATRVIVPYVPSSDDVVQEIRGFIADMAGRLAQEGHLERPWLRPDG